MPELLASPFGCLSFADRSRSAAELIAPQDATTKSAEYSSREPFCPTITLRISRPDGLVSSRSTKAFVLRVTFGNLRAGSTAQACASDFAPTRHGKPSQVSQRIQALAWRSRSFSITPSGV